MSTNLAVIITCFNRKNDTISCLNAIYKQKGLVEDRLNVFLVDDGSTDGTAKAVEELFPKVNIIQGTGDLFWNGGMRLAWKYALTSKPDFYLWINDDSYIYPDAISRLLAVYQNLIENNKAVGAVLGSMVDPNSKKLTYGGRLRCSLLNPVKIGPVVEPSAEAQKCDFINGNLTLIPAQTVNTIGILSEDFTHSMGDFDYGLRANKNGLYCWVAPGFYGECEVNSIEGSWQDKSIPLDKRVNLMKNITQLPPLKEWTVFIKRHCGWQWGILYLDALLKDKLPKVWLFVRGKI